MPNLSGAVVALEAALREVASWSAQPSVAATNRTRAGASVDGGVAGRAADGMIAVGTPDDLIKLFRTYQKIGVDQMLMWVQFGGLEHAKIMQSLEMIGKHVIPELAKVPA